MGIGEYLTGLYEKFVGFSQCPSTQYRQICGRGCAHIHLKLRNGVVDAVRRASDLSVEMRTSDKEGKSWRQAASVFADFSFLNQWAETLDGLKRTSVRGADTRPPFDDTLSAISAVPKLAQYDAVIGNMASPLVFHRMFETTKNLLESGYRVDADMVWRVGGISADQSAHTFAFIDNDRFYFEPQTQIETRLAVYHPEMLHVRRFCHHTSWRFADAFVPEKLRASMEDMRRAPLLSWSAQNFDRLVLMPTAVADILRLVHQGKFGETGIPLSPHIVCVDDPTLAIFRGSSAQTMLDASGRRVKRTLLSPDQFLHRIGTCPAILPASGDIEMSENTVCAESLSESLSGRLLCIEKIRVFDNAEKGESVICAPYGGVLCRDGHCLGYVAPPQNLGGWALDLTKAKAVSNLVRLGSMALCALDISGDD